jgi:GNAT superfamily N-acetyltransferase
VTPEELLKVYDTEVRGSFLTQLPAGWVAEQDGPVVRCLTNRDGFVQFIEDASGLAHGELVSLVDRTFAYFADRGVGFEWKTFDHDRPDLPPLLVEHGARPEPHEALVLGDAAPLAGPPVLPPGLILRAVESRADFEAIAALKREVWGGSFSWLADDLQARLAGDGLIEIAVVEDRDRVVSAAWLVAEPGSRIAGLWGGSTLEAYRGRGLYRALVAYRAQRAVDLGYPILQVDASDDSRPILQRLGLHVVGGTTPYVKAA